MARNSLSHRLVAALLLTASLYTNTCQAETNWLPAIKPNDSKSHETSSDPTSTWEAIPQSNELTIDLVWEPLTVEQSRSEPEDLDWNDLGDNPQEEPEHLANDEDKSEDQEQQKSIHGFRWPNGQLMSIEDQIYYRTAYSRGSMIQIGETVYPNLGFNALQRQPNSWGSIALVAIDDTRIGSSYCQTGDFFDPCADGLLEASLRLWNSPALSLDLHWTMHSLSGEGSPFDFSVGDQNFGGEDVGTRFGEGQSIGFALSKNFGKTFGLTFGGYRLLHFDETTDLPRNFALFGTKVFRLNDTIEPPIVSLSLGLMSDVFNNETNLGTVKYPKNLRGGLYPSLFADRYDETTSGYTYYSNVAGVSSAFVCGDRSIFAGKPIESVDKSCIEEVYVGPIASIGFAPWPWLGIYAKYSGTDLDFGISLKPFKKIPWNISVEAMSAIKGINPTIDDSFALKECREKSNSSFADCRTRVGIFTQLSF